MNELEESLNNDEQLDFYLESVSKKDFRLHVEEIRKKAAISTDAGKLREAILEVLYENSRA